MTKKTRFPSLAITLIDVGWGDSILIESKSASGTSSYALVDSNDTSNLRSSQMFLQRHFEKRGYSIAQDKPFFEFVLLTHAHADHGQGLKALMRYFGTKRFWYPKSAEWSGLATLLHYANRAGSNVEHHESIDRTKLLPPLANVALKVLWPPRNAIDKTNENNNSVVLSLTLNEVSFLLSGDAEGKVWRKIAAEIPASTRVFKMPHHGSENGTFLSGSKTAPAWLDDLPADATLAISSHVRPFNHPHRSVVDLLDLRGRDYYRTDQGYHLTFETDGRDISKRWHH